MSKNARIIYVSRLVSLIRTIRQCTHCIRRDKVPVYAAQASFFTIISAVPLISILANIVSLIWPTSAEREKVIGFFIGTVPDSILETAVLLFDEAASSSTGPVLSLSALFIWWSAAKGVGAIREGVQIVYEAHGMQGYFRKMYSSIVYTLVFVVLILTATGLLLSGDFLLSLLHTKCLTYHLMQFS